MKEEKHEHHQTCHQHTKASKSSGQMYIRWWSTLPGQNAYIKEQLKKAHGHVFCIIFSSFSQDKSLKTREISALKIPREVMDQLMQRAWLRLFPDATSICSICPRPCNHSLTWDCSHRELLLQVWLGIWGSMSLWLELRRTRHHRTECEVQTLTGSWRLKLSRQ